MSGHDDSGLSLAQAAHDAGAVEPVVVLPTWDVSVTVTFRGTAAAVAMLARHLENEAASEGGVVNVVAAWREH